MFRVVALNLLACTVAFGQPDFRFHRYGLANGLPSPNVHAIAEDHYGQLWFGTDNGLASFNGSTFNIFRNAGGSQPQLTSNDVTHIFPLPTGDLLVGTTAGLHLFDHEKQQFLNKWGNLPQSYISGIVPDEKGGFWTSSSTGLYHSTSADSIPEAYYKDEQSPLFNTGIFAIYLDKENVLWITTSRKGFFKLLIDSNELKNYRNQTNDPTSLSSNVMRQIAPLPDGRLVLGTADAGYNVFDPKTEKFTRYNNDPSDPNSLSSTSAFSILVDKKSTLWIGTWANGLNMINTETWQSRIFKSDPDNKYSIGSNSIPVLFESSQGDIWIGSNSGGVARLTYGDQNFHRYRHDNNHSNSLTVPYVRSVYEGSDGRVWLGTNQGGLNRFDPIINRYTVYLKPDETRDALSRGTIWSISESIEGNIWFGTSRGVGQWNKKTDRITFLDYDNSGKDPKKLSGNNVLKVLDDQEGNLWVGIYYGGLNRVDLKTGYIEKFRHDDSNPVSISSDDIIDVFLDSKKQVWVACDDGLSLLNRHTKTFKRYLMSKANPSIFHINEGKDGTIYLATEHGLATIDPKTDAIKIVGEAEGLNIDHATSILIDDNNYLWLGTNYGIDRYDPKTGDILHLNELNGLAANDTEGKACFKSKNGKLYFAGTDGATSFHPSTILQDNEFPRVLFTGLSVFNKPVPVEDTTILNQSIHTLDRITLQYSDYVFALEFAALRFQAPEAIRYAYKLEGFDKSWIYTTAEDRKAVYTNVPQGTYTMKVKASNIQGKFADSFTSLVVVVQPPWWKTWWARTLVYGTALILITLLIRGRIAFIKQQNIKLEKQVALQTAEVHAQKEKLQIQAEALEKANLQKTKLFSIIAHDLKSPVNSLKALVSLLDPKMITADDLEIMKREINKRVEGVSVAMEDLLAWAGTQLEIETIQIEPLQPANVVQEIADLYLTIAAGKNIIIKTEVQSNRQILADINLLRAILRNLTSNALKFTKPGGQITLRVSETDSAIQLSVQDTGVGIEPNKALNLFSPDRISTTGTSGEKGVGLGLQVVHDFVQKLNGKIWVESEVGVGTTFYCEFPGG